jgi:DNA-binding NtrC family response regulator
VGELSAPAQAALLRVLETKRVTRVGSTKELPVDVRILAATHRDLDALVVSGGFRQDLLYRLNALTLQVPPLRERPEDIEALARAFLAQANAANDCTVEDIDSDALELLGGYAWPGNVRELRNVIERATVIAQGSSISAEDLPEHVAPPIGHTATESKYLDFRAQMERLEADVIVRALEQTGWNQTAAARELSMPLRTLQYKIKVLEIARPPRTRKPK